MYCAYQKEPLSDIVAVEQGHASLSVVDPFVTVRRISKRGLRRTQSVLRQKGRLVMASAETKAVATADEGELVKRISDQLKLMEDTATKIKQTVLQQAIDLGPCCYRQRSELAWLEQHKLAISERSAQRYMMLRTEWPKIDAWMKANSATVADLTLNKAQKIIATSNSNDTSSSSDASSTTTSDTYDKIAEKLIASLEKMKPDQAEPAAQETIRKLAHTVSVKKGEDWFPKAA
jgi:hypothetical protein